MDLELSLAMLDRDELTRSLLVVKVGNDDRPASDNDIEHYQAVLEEIFQRSPEISPRGVIVTHHVLDIQPLSWPSMVFVRVGSDVRPAHLEDIQYAQESFQALGIKTVTALHTTSVLEVLEPDTVEDLTTTLILKRLLSTKHGRQKLKSLVSGCAKELGIKPNVDDSLLKIQQLFDRD